MSKVQTPAKAGNGVSSQQRTTREVRKLRKHLRDLTAAVSTHLAVLDAIMKAPSTPERGQFVARLANRLNVANDGALHFGLRLSFEKIRKQCHHDGEVTLEQAKRWLEPTDAERLAASIRRGPRVEEAIGLRRTP